MKALEEEMVDVEKTEETEQYISNENASTSLADLLAGIKL